MAQHVLTQIKLDNFCLGEKNLAQSTLVIVILTNGTLIQTIQKVCIRIITNNSILEPLRPLFKRLNILPFRNLYVYKVLTVFY